MSQKYGYKVKQRLKEIILKKARCVHKLEERETRSEYVK